MMISEYQLTKLFQKIKALEQINPGFAEALDTILDVPFKLNMKIAELEAHRQFKEYPHYAEEYPCDQYNIEGD